MSSGRSGVWVVVPLLGAACFHLFTFNASRIPSEVGWGSHAWIESDCANPSRWRLIVGVGPVRSARLANAAAAGWIRSPEDLESIDGIGAHVASKIARHVRWDPFATLEP